MLKRKLFFIILFLNPFFFAVSGAPSGFAGQSPFCRAKSDSSLPGFLFNFAYSYQVPGGDIAKRFGNNSAAGAGISVKTKSNLLISLDYRYLFGANVKETGILDSITTSAGQLIDKGGLLAEIFFQERGFTAYLNAGKIFPVTPGNSNSGLCITAGAGILQHKIRIHYNKQLNSIIPQIEGDYKKGYDRLTNGFALNEFIGYLYLGKSRVVNFIAGFEFTQAWTKNRRYNFDSKSRDDTQHFDLLYGIKLGWFFPLLKRGPEKFYYY